jgi:hypothetical protein
MVEVSNLIDFFDRKISYCLTQTDIHISPEHSLFVCRKDGVFLFQEIDHEEIQRFGALTAGMWQAAESVGRGNENEDYVLQFSSSDSGVFVFPLDLDEDVFLLAVVFKNELNPGKLKNSCKRLRNILIEDFWEEFPKRKIRVKPKDSHEYLFTDISDNEIDQLFSFAGS